MGKFDTAELKELMQQTDMETRQDLAKTGDILALLDRLETALTTFDILDPDFEKTQFDAARIDDDRRDVADYLAFTAHALQVKEAAKQIQKILDAGLDFDRITRDGLNFCRDRGGDGFRLCAAGGCPCNADNEAF
jgi:hypothetical protein